MDENEITLADEGKEVAVEEEIEVVVDDSEPDYADEDLDYDDDGAVILPEDEDADEDTDADTDAAEDKPKENKPDERDAEIAELRRKYGELESQSRDTLRRYGYEGDDVMKGLAQIAADSDGVDVDAYLDERKTALEEEAKKAKADAEAFEAMAAADLAELHAAYPETLAYKHIAQMPKEILHEFARLRDMGLPAKKAYAAANPDGIRTTVASSVKKQTAGGGKQHLTSSVPKGANGGTVTISKATIREWAEDLGVSEKEALEIYKKTL